LNAAAAGLVVAVAARAELKANAIASDIAELSFCDVVSSPFLPKHSHERYAILARLFVTMKYRSND
jgi:hypothetical protein